MSFSVRGFSMKRQDEREREKRTQKYFIVNSSRSLFRILLFFCCRSSLNGIRDFISYTLHFYTQYIEWYKAGRRSRQVRKRTEVAGWARKSLFPSIACNFVYFELESETKARAAKNLKFPIFHAPAEAWTEITNHQKKKQVLNAKQLQLVGRHFQLCKKLPNIPPRNGRNFCYSHPSRVDRKSFSTSSQCDVICDFWCAHKFPQLTLDFCLQQWKDNDE